MPITRYGRVTFPLFNLAENLIVSPVFLRNKNQVFNWRFLFSAKNRDGIVPSMFLYFVVFFNPVIIADDLLRKVTQLFIVRNVHDRN